LQDTLSNLFSGFYIAVAGQIRMGDYIKLNTGEEGYVTDITWRSTAMRGLSNNMVIVPNSKLSQAIVTNYYLPEKRMSSSLQVGVSYGVDLERIEQILMETAIAGSRDIPGMLADPAPSVSFDPGFGESSLGFTVGYQVAEFANQAGVRHHLRKRIYRRFQEEGVEMPFPTRTLYLHEAQAPDELKPDERQKLP
jgi:small-conductance mechanosensitive channel